ncbi:MAG TPA: NAD(P)H-binding protein [Dyadobacter sp.]|nr:NAD(P)H-binding protein [Dyadobacter sp.]
MKIVIIGGTGLIGSNVTKKLRQLGHTVIAGSPSTGINALTGEGLSDALENTDVVVDLSNSPSFEDGPAIQFFQTVGRNILSAELNAGVKHHVVLSIVGTHLMEGMGYMRAKKIQEDLVKKSGVPYTIVRSTQFQEFVQPLPREAHRGVKFMSRSSISSPLLPKRWRCSLPGLRYPSLRTELSRLRAQSVAP